MPKRGNLVVYWSSTSTSALDSLVVEVSESRPFSSNFVRLALVVFCPSASFARPCRRVPSTILLSYSATPARLLRSETKIFFDAEPVGSTRFSPLRLLRRRKWARSFLAFSSWHKEHLTRTKANLRGNNQIENSSRSQIKYHTAIHITCDNWRWILIRGVNAPLEINEIQK